MSYFPYSINQSESVNLSNPTKNRSKQPHHSTKKNTITLKNGPTILINKLPKNFFRQNLSENIQQFPKKIRQKQTQYPMSQRLNSQRKITCQNLIAENENEISNDKGQITSFFGFKEFIGNQTVSHTEQKQQNSDISLDKAGFQSSEDNRTETTRREKVSSKPNINTFNSKESYTQVLLSPQSQSYIEFDWPKHQERQQFLDCTFALHMPINTASNLVKPTYESKPIERGKSLSSQNKTKGKLLSNINKKSRSYLKQLPSDDNQSSKKDNKNLHKFHGDREYRKYESQHELESDKKFCLPPIPIKNKHKAY